MRYRHARKPEVNNGMDNQENDQHRTDEEKCGECYGSGACDPCDGYGFYPDSHPGAGDGPECDCCAGSGDCPECHGTGTATTTTGAAEKVVTS